MDKTNNKFITYLRMFFIGAFIGVCIGLIIFFVFMGGNTLVLTLMKILFAILLYKLFAKFNFNLLIGFSSSLGIGLVLCVALFKGNNITDAAVFFPVFSGAFMMNYIILKLINYTREQIANKNNKNEKKSNE